MKLYSTKSKRIININQQKFFKALDKLETLKQKEHHLNYKYLDKFSALKCLFNHKVINRITLLEESYNTLVKLNIKGA